MIRTGRAAVPLNIFDLETALMRYTMLAGVQ